jgi:hypothetical protein
MVEELRANDLVSEIIVWNNNPDMKLQGKVDGATVVDSYENKIVYGRYLAAEMATNDLIYTQDDDWGPADLRFLLDHHTSGTITAVVPSTHIKKLDRNKFVGWGSLFNKSCLDVFQGYLNKYEEDFLLYREADLLFTNSNLYTSHLSQPRQLVNDDSRSLFLQPAHYQYHEDMLARVKELNS